MRPSYQTGLGVTCRMVPVRISAGADQFLKIPAGVGQHIGAELAHIRQKTLAVEGGQPQLVEHQVVDRRVRKAQEDLGVQGAFQLLPAEKAGQQPVGVVPADGAEDHVGLLVPESLQQIGGPGFGVGGQVSPAGQRVGCKFDLQAQVPQPLQAQVQLVPDEVFPQRTGRQADDGDGLDHGGRLPSRLDGAGPGPPEKSQAARLLVCKCRVQRTSGAGTGASMAAGLPSTQWDGLFGALGHAGAAAVALGVVR